jgi:hypothetical protein
MEPAAEPRGKQSAHRALPKRMTKRMAHHARKAHGPPAELLEWLRDQYEMGVRVLPDGSVAALLPLLTTTSVILGLERWGYARRFCFAEESRAREVFEALQSEDDEPSGFVARR